MSLAYIERVYFEYWHVYEREVITLHQNGFVT
jgi:hypothetical protein